MGSAEVPEIGVEELKRRLEAGTPLQLLDVREPREWEICNLDGAGALRIPLGELVERAEELDRDAELIAFCRTGTRSAFAVEILREIGFERALNLRGGIMAWAEAYDPSMPRY